MKKFVVSFSIIVAVLLVGFGSLMAYAEWTIAQRTTSLAVKVPGSVKTDEMLLDFAAGLLADHLGRPAEQVIPYTVNYVGDDGVPMDALTFDDFETAHVLLNYVSKTAADDAHGVYMFEVERTDQQVTVVSVTRGK